jgi:hypothetical protein
MPGRYRDPAEPVYQGPSAAPDVRSDRIDTGGGAATCGSSHAPLARGYLLALS